MNNLKTVNGDQPVAGDSGTNWSAANWMIGLGYVWFFAGIAAFTPFAAIYYKNLGFTGVQVGVLAAMPAIGLILSGAFWGAVADRQGVHLQMLRASLLLGAIFAFAASRFDTFPVLFVCITLLSFSVVPLRSLLDHYAVMIGEHTGRHFGQIRLWGAFGYTAFALTLGRAMNKEVTELFLIAYSVSLLLTLISTFRLPPIGHVEHESLTAGVRSMLRNPSFKLLLFVAWAQAVAASLIVVSLGVHIKGLEGSTSQVGAAFAIAAVSELPFFMAGAWLMRRFGSTKVITGILVLYTIRMFLLSIVGAPVGVILLQIMHGATFGAFLIAGVPTARLIAGRRHPATAQAVLTLTSFGFGNITGSFLGGALLDHMTTSETYRLSAFMMALTLVSFVVGVSRLGGLQPLRDEA